MPKKLTINEFIEKSKLIHGNKYDYSKSEYKGSNSKICIICPEHGEFWQTASNHIRGQECPKCSFEKRSVKCLSNTAEFVDKAKKIHNNKYDYSKVNYIDAKTKVCIICPEHSEFWQTPNSHLNGHGCYQCGMISCIPNGMSTYEFIDKAKKIHGNAYDYSMVEYVNTHTKVCIICPEHGEFWQTPNCHLDGKGCPKCRESHLERDIRFLLDKNSIAYEYRKKNFEWLKGLELDFFLPDYNIAIECQGEQHFKPVSFGGDKIEKYNKQIKLDKLKLDKCKNNGVELLYFSRKNLVPIDWELYHVITNQNDILDKIINR